MLSPLIGLPLTMLVLLLLAGHVIALGMSDQPECRKRIRMANGVLFMLTACGIYAGTCIYTTTESPREWALSWMAVMMLIAFNVLLAMVDAINTARLRRRALRQIRDASRRFREDLAALGVRLESEHAGSRSD